MVILIKKYVLKAISVSLLCLIVFTTSITTFAVTTTTFYDGPILPQDEYDYPVTFYAKLDEDSKNNLAGIYVAIKEKNTGALYNTNILAVNDFIDRITLPSGEYVVVAGGLRNDYTGKYTIDYPEFSIDENQNNLVIINVTSNVNPKTDNPTNTLSTESYTDDDYENTKTENEESKSENNNSTKIITQSEKTESGSPSRYNAKTKIVTVIIASALVFVVACPCILWLIYKKKQNHV